MSLRPLSPALLLLAAGVLCRPSGAVELLIADFETGLGSWTANDIARTAGRPPAATVKLSGDSHGGFAAMELRTEATEGWAVAQATVDFSQWEPIGVDRLGFSAQTDVAADLVVILARYDDPVRRFRTSVRLEPGDWTQVVLPLGEFHADGDYELRPGVLKALQFGFEGQVPAARVLIDDVRALSPAPEDELGTLSLRCVEAWGHKNSHSVEVFPNGTLRPDTGLSQFLHGRRNHPELYAPLRLQGHCPRPGRFIAQVIETSRYGGAELTLALDGEVKLHREFPGESNSVLRQYAGSYGIDLPAGPHEIVVDNPGADWVRVAEYRLTNYVPWKLWVDEMSGAITARLFPTDALSRQGAHVTALVAGRRFPFTASEDGALVGPALREHLPRGVYPVTVVAHRDGEEFLRQELKLAIRHKRLLLRRAAFRSGEAVVLRVRFTGEAGLPVEGAAVRARIGGQNHLLEPLPDEPGSYHLALGPLPVGYYPLQLSCADPAASEDTRVCVYPPKAEPGPASQIVRLRPDGWFETRSGEPFTPLGFATIHIFQPTFDDPGMEGWFESAWSNAGDQRVADWLGLLGSQGINVIRIGLTVKSDGLPGDMGGYPHPDLVPALRRFLELCDGFGMRVIPVLYWGHWTTFGLQDVPAYDPLMAVWHDWYTGERAIALQQEFTRRVVAPFAGDPRVFAWEPMNEIRPDIEGNPDIPVQWTNRICEAIREVNPDHLITISPLTMDNQTHVVYARHSDADFINYHFYADFSSPPRGIADRVAMCTRLNQMGGKVAIVGEAGATGGGLGGLNPQWVDLATRDCYWPSLLSGATGCIGWDGNTTSPRETGMLAEILAASGWYGCRRDPAPVCVVFEDLREDLWPLIEAEALLADRGVWFDPVLQGAPVPPGSLVVPLSQLPERLPALPRLVEATAPYAAVPLVADGGTLAVIYLRNEGGFNGYGGRLPEQTDLNVAVHLPGRHTLTVWDLDAREQVATTQFTDHGAFAAQKTWSDYVLVIKQAR